MSEIESAEQPNTIESKELFALLGEFLVKFQGLCANLQFGIRILDVTTGKRNDLVIRALTLEMSPSSLLKSFNSVLRELHKVSEFDIRVISRVYDMAMDVIEKRNELIHGEWFVSDPDEFPFEIPPTSARKMKHSKAGVKEVSINVSADYLRSVIAECSEASICILFLWVCTRSEMTLDQGFSFDSDGKLRRRRASDVIADEVSK